MTIIIPTKVTDGKELVIIPKEEYESLVELKKIYEFQPTAAQKKALNKARRKRGSGKVLTFSEFKHNLDLAD